MAQEQPRNEIQLFDFAYDHNHRLTKVVYRGREAAVAVELGRLLRYAKNGGKLAEMITTRWAARFREGIDYEVLKGRDLQDFKELPPLEGGSSWRIHPSTPQLMILYTSGIDLVLLLAEKRIGDHLRRWITDVIFPSLRKTRMFTLDGFEQKALPVIALFHREIITALSKIRGAQIAQQKEHATPRDYAHDWNDTHQAHTAPMYGGKGKTAQQIRVIAEQRGLKVLSNMSARQLMYDMIDFRHTNISESAEIDLERIGVPRERARRIAIDKGQPYFKELVVEGVDQASLEGQLGLPE